MKHLATFLILSCFIGLQTFAQQQKIPLDESKKLGSAVKSEIFQASCQGSANAISSDLKWKPILVTKRISHELEAPNQEKIEEIKAEKTKLKQGSKPNPSGDEINKTVTPVVGANWAGNNNDGSSPLDNSLAISDGGVIVSVANSTIEIDDMSGNNQYYNSLTSFFNDPSIVNTCDPVVLYDRPADRFILFFQECSGNSANSKLCISFSKSNNPAADGWWTYKITGNPMNDNSWFDYPKMAVSDNELYITGNLFHDDFTNNQSVVYQINKTAAYSGGSMNWQYWKDIPGAPFTLLPVGNGQGLAFGPGCYLVSTESSGAATINLYDLTDDMSGTPALNFYSVNTSTYSPAGEASQKNSSCTLNTGDSRALSGFYLNGIIHFVFNSDAGSGWNGINYNRLNVAALTNQSKIHSQVGSFDCAYPSVASYAMSPTDKSVMIGFGRSSSSIFPEIRVVNCDDNMNFSASTLVKSSANFVSYTSSFSERWGDYTGTCRKHEGIAPSVWVNGMFGNANNAWDSWIAEVHDAVSGLPESSKTEAQKVQVYPNPVQENFTLHFTLPETTELLIQVTDENGRIVKVLYQGKGHAGENIFTFNKSNLSQGTYFLDISAQNKNLKHEKISIIQ